MARAIVALTLVLTLAGCARSAPALADDPTLATHVKIAFLNDPVLAELRIQASAEAGVVTLAGVVRAPEQVERAIEVARRVQGVRDVVSRLTVRPPTSRS
jgi:osmotically-inducible protein OsmY